MPEAPETPFHVRILSSSLGGVITAFLMTPLDVVKIRMQTSVRQVANGECLLYCSGLMDHICPCPNSQYNCEVPLNLKKSIQFTSSLDAVRHIVRNDGVKSLWCGLSPALVMALPQTIIYYSLNDYLKDKFSFYDKKTLAESNKMDYSQLFVTMGVAGLSRAAAVSAISPIELTRTKMQSIKMTYLDTFSAIRDTVKKTGFSGLWLGIGPTLLRDIPYSMSFFAIFDYFKYDHLHRNPKDNQMSFVNSFGAGTVAGFISGIITHPFDVIKTHQQIQLGEAIINDKPVNSSTCLAIKSLYRQQGLKALYSGFAPRIMKTSLASAIMISIFETAKSYFVTIEGSLSSNFNPSKN